MKLLNGSYGTQNFNGTVKLFDNFHIRNVLHIPKFTFSFIFEQHITDSDNCKLIFSLSPIRFRYDSF